MKGSQFKVEHNQMKLKLASYSFETADAYKANRKLHVHLLCIWMSPSQSFYGKF